MKLLIAEDDSLIREGLSDILVAEGYDCILAEDGEQALRIFTEQQPQMVLLDIMMPNMDGYNVCREIRRLDQHTAIIFISAKSEEIDRVLGLELGADDYIMKPFGKHEVVARVRAVTRRYRLSEQNSADSELEVFAMGDLRVNLKEMRAERNQQCVDLSLRDCKILQLLHANCGNVVSREQLFNVCWGRDYLASSRTLDQHISMLRKRIEIDPLTPSIIKTIHGVGYRYDASNTV
ncbi:response regulator transcription factor [Arenicella xantha]|uniref:DNA-binding response OmpR family regulator n=1 Tax=Arenicella xantha TaxID=644221 RepID=A0A395JPD0_9GAMM|nr:response regulator transcription factor [Arenicella xantha]RBP53203.1 DNA-binding response OmpR family regulator [Arenicella xantha]